MTRRASPAIAPRPAPPGYWGDSGNILAHMAWLERKLGIQEPEDWYAVTQTTVRRLGSHGILSRYGNSLFALLQDYIPWYDWKEWLFPHAPRQFWQDPGNRRRYLDWLGEILEFSTPEDWYSLQASDLSDNRGGRLLALYKHSPCAVVMAHFPEHEWFEWKFNNAPARFWDDPTNQRRYLDWLGAELGFKKIEDWYRLKGGDLVNNFGRSLLKRFHHSPARIVMAHFPEHEWLEWKFSQVPGGFWGDPGNRRRYLAWLGAEHGFKKIEDWYRVSRTLFSDHCGSTLLTEHRGRPAAVIMENLPDHEWMEWFFKIAPAHFWEHAPNRRRYLEWLGERLGYQKIEDWYGITLQDFVDHQGHGLLKRYRVSPSAIIVDNFPEHQWLEWRFARVPCGFWDQPANRRRYLRWLGRELGFRKPKDWRRLTYADLKVNHGSTLLGRYGSLSALLRDSLPKAEWEK